MRFQDRRHAGTLLGAELAGLSPADPVVYALPRGGVPVGFGVAQALSCPLDVLVVRKVGVPFQPELAMGALGEGNVVIRNADVLDAAGIKEDQFDLVAAREEGELKARLDRYRSVAEAIAPEGHTALVVDDGLATGSTAKAAIAVLRARGAATVWLAVPVAPAESLGELERLADRVVVLAVPRHFGAVGTWYRNFSQTSDDEVRSLLAESRSVS